MPLRLQHFRRPKPARPLWPALGLALLLLFPEALVPATQRPASSSSKIESSCVFNGVRRIVAIGDLHGAYEPFVEILQGMRIVDENLRWIAGTTHLVQTGDIMDRGTRARDILDLLRNLEVEAQAAGGAVHVLLGNHEEMNILGLSFELKGYVTPEQYRDFIPPSFRERKEREFRRLAGPTADLNLYWEKYIEEDPDAPTEYTYYFRDRYGKWLATRPAVIKIDDTVFVHGGLTEALSVLPCSVINAGYSREINQVLRGEEPDRIWLNREDGPTWYREMATKSESILREEADRILANLGAKAIVIGHTPTSQAISLVGASRLGGKIWVIDTGIWLREGGRKSALLIENGRIRMTPGRIEDEGGHK